MLSKFYFMNDWLIYILNLNRALGTDEPLFNMHSGRLQASLDRVEAILTHSDDAWFGIEDNVNEV